MIVQIYSLTDPEEVRKLVALGVDHIGFAVGDQGVPAQIFREEARELFELVPPPHRTVALSVATEIEEVLELAYDVRPNILHLCSETEAIAPERQREVRRRLPDGTALMKAIEVADKEAIEAARRFAPVSDYLILDTASPDVAGVGASGRTHDWSISRRIVEEVEVPTILAGGLEPGNVAEAIRTVRPAGVDSYTGTSRTERRKDLERVRDFVEAARAAGAATRARGQDASPEVRG